MKRIRRFAALTLSASLLLGGLGVQASAAELSSAAVAACEAEENGLDVYDQRLLSVLLVDTEGENRVFSPVNIYLALGMVAEVTEGESRDQLLDLLGAQDIEALRARCEQLWADNDREEDEVVSRLAASLWLREDDLYNTGTLDRLAEEAHAEVHQGVPGSEEMNTELQKWLNDNTGGLLEDQAGEISLDPETMLALATSIYYRARWSEEFAEEATDTGIFHAPDGEEDVRYMHQTHSGLLYSGAHFTAVSRHLNGSGSMWFILPEEGYSPELLIKDGDLLRLLADSGETESSYATIRQTIPKFDITADLDLIPALKSLGVTDLFDAERADFTPLTKEPEEICVTQAKHAARVMIDEEGCIAAAYTVIDMVASAMPPEDEVDFTLDRPFIFAVTGETGDLLFTGIVNHP